MYSHFWYARIQIANPVNIERHLYSLCGRDRDTQTAEVMVTVCAAEVWILPVTKLIVILFTEEDKSYCLVIIIEMIC